MNRSPHLYCTADSPTGGAVISANIAETASQKLWRHSEKRGLGLSQTSCSLLRTLYLLIIPFPFMAPKWRYSFWLHWTFQGSGNWSESHASRGFRVHDGVDVSGRAPPAMFQTLLWLASWRVCLDWRACVPSLMFGTLRRPQIRSKRHPAGFNPQDPLTAFHNMLARRTAFILTLVLLSGHYNSVKQPEKSHKIWLHCYKVMVSLGCAISYSCFCSFGSPFQKDSQWLHK